MKTGNIKSENYHSWPRRKFIATGLQVTGFTALASLPLSSFANEFLTPPGEYTVAQISDMIFKECGFTPTDTTVDIIKAGNRDMKVTGILTTMFPTIEIIQKAIKLKSNLIIVHEPTFYSGNRSETSWTQNSDVINRKLQLLNDNNICIWRAHDSWHAIKPDGITNGVIKKLGWENYYHGEETFTIPSINLKQLVKHLKLKLQIEQVRVIGDKQDVCSKVTLLPGAWGGKMQMSSVIQNKPDVLIVGEVAEWETAEYIRDARLLGDKVSLIVLGHAVSEEPGMEWMAEWLQPKLPGLKITHIASKNPFAWI